MRREAIASSLLLSLLSVSPAAASEVERGAVLDLCELAEASSAKRWTKQRGVLLGPANIDRFDADPRLDELGAARHARQTFISRFPLDRLYNVVTSLPGDGRWLERRVVPLAEVGAALRRAPLERPFAGDEPGAEARERDFVVRSLACADWVFVPVVDRVGVTWRRQTAEVRSVSTSGASSRQREIWLPTIEVALRVGVFRRVGDKLKRVRVAEGGGRDHRGMPDIPPTSDEPVPAHISAIPTPCEAASECSESGTARRAMLAFGRNEESTGVCRGRTLANPDGWSTCEVRRVVERATGGAQKTIRELEGLALFAELERGNVKDRSGPGIALGRHEGVKVGYAFYTKSADGEIDSYFKVTRVGPGGEEGELNRSALRSRFGEFDFGERVYEYPQSNLYLGARLGGGPLLGMGGPMAGNRSFPSWIGGPSLSVMWDYSALSRIPESRTGAEIHLLTGLSETVGVLAIPIDFPNLEWGFYLGQRTKLFASIAISGGVVFVGEGEAAGGAVYGEASRGKIFGGAAAIGVEYMGSPDRLYRLDLAGRTYDASFDDPELDARNDSYSTVMARLSLELAL